MEKLIAIRNFLSIATNWSESNLFYGEKNVNTTEENEIQNVSPTDNSGPAHNVSSLTIYGLSEMSIPAFLWYHKFQLMETTMIYIKCSKMSEDVYAPRLTWLHKVWRWVKTETINDLTHLGCTFNCLLLNKSRYSNEKRLLTY